MPKSLIAEIRAKPGQADRLSRMLSELSVHVRREAGNIEFSIYRQQDSDLFSVLETYRDQEAFESHLAQPYGRTFNEALKTIAIGGKSVLRFVQEISPSGTVAPQVRGLDHVGLTVPDIDAADRFLCEVFGAVAVYDVLPKGHEPMQGAQTEQQLGLRKDAQVVHMRLMRIGESACLELFEVEQVAQEAPVGIAGVGLTHLGIYVDDIEATSRRFEAAGGSLLSPVHALAGVEEGKGNAGVYGRAPWGSLIELITYPAGISYPAEAPTTR